MSIYFFDTSALVKRYVVEPGTHWIRSIVSPQSRNTILIAHITRAEVVSSMSRRRREGQIPAQAAQAMRVVIDLHARSEYQVIPQTEQVMHLAEDLLEGYPLRAYDSIQLASALHSRFELVVAGLSVTFVSSDKRLLDVAIAEGMTIEDPNTYP